MIRSIRSKLASLRRQRGQGMTEYIIIVALIAIAAIGVVTVFGQDIRQLFNATTSSLSGVEQVTANTKDASKQASAHKNLKTFGGSNKGN